MQPKILIKEYACQVGEALLIKGNQKSKISIPITWRSLVSPGETFREFSPPQPAKDT